MKKLILFLPVFTASLAYGQAVPLVSHSHINGNIVASTITYIPVGDTVFAQYFQESWAQIPFYEAGVFSDMRVRLISNDLTGYTTATFRINGVDGDQRVVLGPGVTLSSDTVNADHIDAGDLVSVKIVTGAGVDILPVELSFIFTPDDPVSFQRFSPAPSTNNGLIITNGYQSYFSNITGILGANIYEAQTVHVMRTSGTFRNLAVNVVSNARTVPTHYSLRKNGVTTALSTSALSGISGLLQQTTTEIAVVVGDTVTFELGMTDGSDANPINISYFSVEFVNDGDEIEYASGFDQKPQNAGETWTIPYKSALTFGGDEYQLIAQVGGTLRKTCVFSGQNDCSTISTVKIRKNGTTDPNITVTIPAGSTGTFCDNVNTISFASTDTIAYIGNSPSGTGTLYYSSIMSAFDPATVTGEPGVPVISPTIPIVNVNEGKLLTSTHTLVTWSLMGGSTGSITSNGFYTAPGPLRPKQTLYGCITSPQDMIWNTNISSLPVDTSSTNYMRAQAGSAQMALEPDMPMNLYGLGTSSQSMVFNYTPSNNGDFKVGDALDLRVENGVFADKDVDKDTHVLAIDTNTCIASELYKLYPIGSQSDCLTCNSQSGVTINNRYNIVQGPTAGGLPITSLQIKYRELRDCVDRGIPIQHALRMTFSVGILANSHKWPAVAHATDGGELPFGTYVRLVSTYSATGSAGAQCIQQTLKDFGAILDDGGINGHVQIEQSAIADYDLFSIMNELAGISEFKVRNLESVNVSSLQDTNTASPTYGYGRVTSTNSYVQPTSFAVAIASNTNSGQSSFMPIIIRPVSIGTEREVGYSFQAGADQYQIPIWVKGASDTSFSCSMTPTIGTLTSGGLYTPPTTSTIRSSGTVTCTATADSANAKVIFPILVYPDEAIRVRLANATNVNYGPDTNGDTWYVEKGAFWRLQGRSNCDWRSETWTGVTDQDLYQECQYVNDGSGDLLAKYILPNGIYEIKLHFAVGDSFSANTWAFGVDSQDEIYTGSSATPLTGDGAWTFFGLTGYKVDLCDIIGACTSDTPGTITLSRNVTNGELYFAIRHLTVNGEGSKPSLLNAFSITKTADLPDEDFSATLQGAVTIKGGVTIR